MIGLGPNRSLLSCSRRISAGLFIVFFLTSTAPGLAQRIPVNFPLLTDKLRREQLLGQFPLSYSFQQFPHTWAVVANEWMDPDSLGFSSFGKPLLNSKKNYRYTYYPSSLVKITTPRIRTAGAMARYYPPGDFNT